MAMQFNLPQRLIPIF